MSLNIAWKRILRTVVVAGLLLIALLGAVLGMIGASGPQWMWAADPVRSASTPAVLTALALG